MDSRNQYLGQVGTEGRLVTEDELADRWHRSRRTVQRWRKLGYGPAFIRIGGSVFYRVADVLAFEEARRKAVETGE